MPLYRRLTHELTWLKSYQAESTSATSRRNRTPSLRHHAVVGVGANIGDVYRRFAHLKVYLLRDKRVQIEKISSVLKNPPFGFLEQDDFYNSVIALKTSMPAKVFMQFLLRSEKRFRRQRSFADAPRTLDLDLIFFDNLVMKTEFLTLPHPHYKQRESVTLPLIQIKEYR